MHRSVRCCVRFRDWFSRSKPDVNGRKEALGEAFQVSEDHVEARALREEELERKKRTSLEQRFRDGDSPEELDRIFARGFLKSLTCYFPPKDLDVQVSEALSDTGIDVSPEKWETVNLKEDPVLKFKLLTLMESRLDHSVPTSRLHEMKTAADVFRFYQEPVKNRTMYTDLSRSTEKPKNLTVTEYPLRFYPEEVEVGEGEKVSDMDPHKRYAHFHKGITAFPKHGVLFDDPRAKKLYRQFQGKTEWHHYQDRHFDHTETPPDAPWDSETAKTGDRRFRPPDMPTWY